MNDVVNKPTGAYRMDRDEYDRIPYLNCSKLKVALRSTQHFKAELNKDPATPSTSKALAFGSAFHTYCLEPHLFDDECAVCPNVDRRTKAGKATWAGFLDASSGKVVVQESELEQMDRMIDALHDHTGAASLLFGDGNEYEMTYISNPKDEMAESMTSESLKGRIDVVNKSGGMLIDLKTCQDASPDAVSRTVLTYGYHIQAAFYSHLHRQVYGENPTFHFVFVEKEAPHGILVATLDDEWLEYGAAECQRGIQAVSAWRLFGATNYNDGKAVTLAAPSFIKNRNVNIQIGETNASN